MVDRADILTSAGMAPAQRSALALWAVLSVLAVTGSAALVAAGGGAASAAGAALITFGACATGGWAILRGLGSGAYPHDRLGLCNGVTMARGAGVAVLAGLVVAPGALAGGGGFGWAVVALAATVLALDGLDGWLARRSGLRSAFGARFDVEADVIFAVVMAALAWQAGKVGAWFLLIGGLRPAFLLAGMLWPALRAPLPEARWRKVMAALQMTVQVVLLAPVLVPPLSGAVGGVILAAMLLSFAVDIRWLLRNRSGPATLRAG